MSNCQVLQIDSAAALYEQPELGVPRVWSDIHRHHENLVRRPVCLAF